MLLLSLETRLGSGVKVVSMGHVGVGFHVILKLGMWGGSCERGFGVRGKVTANVC